HQIAGRDAGRAQRQLERGQLLAMFPDPFGEKHLLGNESDHVTLLQPAGARSAKAACRRESCMVNTNFPSVNAGLTCGSVHDRVGHLTISSLNMTRTQARESARELLEIMPLVMRPLAAELRAAGEMPAPAHFALLAMLAERP